MSFDGEKNSPFSFLNAWPRGFTGNETWKPAVPGGVDATEMP